MSYQDEQFPDITWFPTLVSGENCLRKKYPARQTGSEVVVRRKYQLDGDIKDGKQVVHQIFACFPDAKMLYEYILIHEAEKRDFYEFVTDDQYQKPRFDIDIDLKDLEGKIDDPDKFFDSVLSALKLAIRKEIGLGTDDIHGVNVEKVYTSHGKFKRSAHVVIHKMYHKSAQGAKAFYLKLMQYIPEQYRKHIDRAVYSRGQNFRLLYCQKWGSGRIKLLTNSSDHKIIKLEPTYVDFCESLLTYICEDFKEIPYEAPAKVSSWGTEMEGELPYDLVCDSMQLLSNLTRGNLPYSVRSHIDGFIFLNRTEASHCALHGRVHDSENPFLTLKYNQVDGSFAVYFNCRRDPPAKPLCLGMLNASKASTQTLLRERVVPVETVLVETKLADGSKIMVSQVVQSVKVDSPTVFSAAPPTTINVQDCKNTVVVKEPVLDVKSVRAQLNNSSRIYSGDELRATISKRMSSFILP